MKGKKPEASARLKPDKDGRKWVTIRTGEPLSNPKRSSLIKVANALTSFSLSEGVDSKPISNKANTKR